MIKSELWNNFGVPSNFMNFFRERITGLLHISIIQHTTLKDMLASAYMQGIIDAQEVLNRAES